MISSLRASSRKRSASRRWISGSDVRRRSRRGGKSPTGAAAADLALTFAPLQPNQKAVAEHDQGRVTVKAWPQPALVLIPTQAHFGFFMKLLDPGAPVSVLGHHRQRRVGGKVAPEVFRIRRLAPPRPLANRPTDMPRTV